MKKIIFLAVIGTAAAVLYGCVEVVPPRSLTAVRMHMLKRKVLRYARQHGELPASVQVLPEMHGYDNSALDAWKRPIIFETSPSGSVTFRSLGRDGKIGGEGDDADIIRSFPARNAQRQWSDEGVDWSEDTFRTPKP